MDKQIKEWRGQIDLILARHADDAEFLRWAALKLAMLERALNDRKEAYLLAGDSSPAFFICSAASMMNCRTAALALSGNFQ